MPWTGWSSKYGPVAGPGTPFVSAFIRSVSLKAAPDGGVSARYVFAGSTDRARSRECWASTGSSWADEPVAIRTVATARATVAGTVHRGIWVMRTSHVDGARD